MALAAASPVPQLMAMPAPGTPVTLPPPASSPPPACSFACARTLHVGFPSAFLWVERFKWALAGVIDETRPMDAMPLSFDTPAEDEIATSALTGAPACRAGGNLELGWGHWGAWLAAGTWLWACNPALASPPAPFTCLSGCPCYPPPPPPSCRHRVCLPAPGVHAGPAPV